MNRLFEAHGPSGMIDAAQALLASDAYDMAVVRSVYSPDSPTLQALANPEISHRDNTDRLAGELPQLQDVHNLITGSWATNGYTGMRIRDGFYLDQLRQRGIPSHVDDLIYRDRTIEAGLQLSLCLRGVREFNAERLILDDIRTPLGGLCVDAYNNQTDSDSPLFSDIMCGRTPRTGGVLTAGDMAMFPHHPVVTLHSVRHLQPDSLGRLISFNADAI